MSKDQDLRGAIRLAALTAGALIAYQVGGKATRDALFLSTYDVSRLPMAVLAATVFSVVMVLITSKLMLRIGPGRLIPRMLLLSASLLLVEWGISSLSMRVAAAAVYLHFNALGALLISGFWSVISERFDPRAAKQQVGNIGAAGTAGGLVGALVAERLGVAIGVTAMLPVLAALHVLAALAMRGLAVDHPAGREQRSDMAVLPSSARAAAGALVRESYLRRLVSLVVLVALTEGLLDYVFKAESVAAYGRGPALIRFFAAFYAIIQVVTFLVQIGFTRRLLEWLGLARTVALLPASVGMAGVGLWVVPGFITAAASRGLEAVLHNSLYRSAYEVLFTPVPRDQKRATKLLVDVGCVRLGDALGAGAVQLSLLLGPITALPVLTLGIVVLSLAAATVAVLLDRAYVRALERSLLARAVHLDSSDVGDSTTRTAFLSTIAVLGEAGIPRRTPPRVTPVVTRVDPEVSQDPEVLKVAELRSGDAGRVRAALAQPLSRSLVGQVIPLLAWDAVAADVAAALRRAMPEATGQLSDALLDPAEDFAVRRRIPRILSGSDSERAVAGLVGALRDARFEVRYQAGRALARRAQKGAPPLPEADVYAAVLREVEVGEGVWKSQRLLDRVEDDESPFLDQFLRERASRSLEHVFTLLSLVLPRQPLVVAFRGLHTDDPILRGTALEYLESVLPDPVRERIWPFLDEKHREPRGRARASILTELLQSNQSIAANLDALKRRAEAGPD